VGGLCDCHPPIPLPLPITTQLTHLCRHTHICLYTSPPKNPSNFNIHLCMTYVCACIYVRVHMKINTSVCTHNRRRILRISIYIDACLYVRVCIYTCRRVCIHICLQASPPKNLSNFHRALPCLAPPPLISPRTAALRSPAPPLFPPSTPPNPVRCR